MRKGSMYCVYILAFPLEEKKHVFATYQKMVHGEKKHSELPFDVFSMCGMFVKIHIYIFVVSRIGS